jgi:hypothetical protein
MLTHISTVHGRLVLALGTALFAGSMTLPASAPAAPAPRQPAEFQCNPWTDNCFPLHAWYSDDSHGTLVGNGHGYCNASGYEVTAGYETPYVALIGWGYCID